MGTPPSSKIEFDRIRLDDEQLNNMYFKGTRSTQSPSGEIIWTPCVLQYLDGSDVNRVEKACEWLTELKHDNIVRIHGFTVDTDGRVYLVLDDEDNGVSVVEASRDLRRDSDTKALLFAIDIAQQLVSALMYLAIKNVVHMDLGLVHIVLRHESRVALRGFCNPIYVNVEKDNAPGGKIGDKLLALRCLVPELLTESRMVDYTADHYLLGWMLCELITGELPHPCGTSKGSEDTRQRVMVGADLVIDDLSWPSCAPQVLKDAIRRLLSFNSSLRGSLRRLAAELNEAKHCVLYHDARQRTASAIAEDWDPCLNLEAARPLDSEASALEVIKERISSLPDFQDASINQAVEIIKVGGLISQKFVAQAARDDDLVTLKACEILGLDFRAPDSLSGDAPIHAAARCGNTTAVDYLRSRNVGLEERNVKGETPLFIAVDHNREDVMEYLLRFGAKVNSRTTGGSTPLQAALRKGNLSLFALLQQHGANTSIALYDAIMTANVKAVERLLQDKGDLRTLEASSGRPLLMIVAAAIGDASIIRLLADALKDQDQDPHKPLYGQTPLHVAACLGNVDAIRALVSVGADVNAQEESNGSTPACLAAQYGAAESIAVLLELGADLIKEDYAGSSPIHIAAIYGHVNVIVALKKGKRVSHSAKRKCDSMTPLALAAKEGHTAAFLQLARYGMPPATDGSPLALIEAAAAGHIPIIEAIFECYEPQLLDVTIACQKALDNHCVSAATALKKLGTYKT